MVAHMRANLHSEEALESNEALSNNVHVFPVLSCEAGPGRGTTSTKRTYVDIPKDPALKDVLSQVTALYIHGFMPRLPQL